MRLEVTRRAELAVRAVATLAERADRVKAGELAEALTTTTTGFVPQVVGPLVKAGWVRSDPGPTGGYSLRPTARALSVLEVIEAVDGPLDDGRCVAADRPCSAGQPCVLHLPWQSARHELRTQLSVVPAITPHPVPDTPGGTS